MYENSGLLMDENIVKNRRGYIISVSSVFFAIWLFSLVSGYGTITNLIAAILSIGYSLIAFSMPGRKKTIMAFLLFYAFHVATSFFYISSVYYLLGTCIAYTFAVYSPIFVNEIRKAKNNERSDLILFRVSTFIWFLIIAVSMYTYINNPEGGRAYVNDHRGGLLGGGYCAAYASAVLGVILFNYFLSSDKKLKKKRVYLLIGFIMSVVHVIVTLSMITLLGLLVGCILSIVFHGKKRKNTIKGYLFLVVVIIGVILFLTNAGAFGKWLIQLGNKVSNPIYSKRLYEVGDYLSTGTETHHMVNRFYTLSTSWETFLKNPLFGIGYKFGNNYTLLYQNGIGVHSELLDLLAKYGVVGSLPLLYVIIQQIKKIIKSSSLSIGIPLVFSLVVLFVFNPFISAQTMFMLFLYIPLLIERLEIDRCWA